MKYTKISILIILLSLSTFLLVGCAGKAPAIGGEVPFNGGTGEEAPQASVNIINLKKDAGAYTFLITETSASFVNDTTQVHAGEINYLVKLSVTNNGVAATNAIWSAELVSDKMTSFSPISSVKNPLIIESGATWQKELSFLVFPYDASRVLNIKDNNNNTIISFEL